MLKLASRRGARRRRPARAGRAGARHPQRAVRHAQPLQPQGRRAGRDRRRAQRRRSSAIPTKAAAAAPYIAKRLDALADETERGWQGTFVEGEGFLFERTVRGVKEVAIIDQALLGSADARKLDEYAAALQGAYAKPGIAAPQGRGDRSDPRPGRACSRRSPRRPQGPHAAALQRPGRDEPGAALGNHARHRRALAAAGEGQGNRRGRATSSPS